MAIDREATLKNAEKYLRVGRLDAAIAEYVRLMEDQPKDWTSANALGDLYQRAGQPDKAVGLYRGIAEHFFAEGFYPKAGALFKKILKIVPGEEQCQLRLAEISATQGLMADAKAYYTAIAERRRAKGDAAGADEIVIRLGTLDPNDVDARLAAARAAERGGNLDAAAQQYRTLYDDLVEQGREADAAEVLRDCVRCRPDADDSSILLPLATLELREGRLDRARDLLGRLIASGPAGRDAVVGLAWNLSGDHPAASSLCVELAGDAMVAGSDFTGAASLLQEFARRVPGQVPTLLRLVEVSVDGGLEAAMYDAQAQLADAYLSGGQAGEARVIAEDLVSRDPSEAAHVARLRRALEMLGVPDVDEIVAERLARAAADTTAADDFDDVQDPDRAAVREAVDAVADIPSSVGVPTPVALDPPQFIPDAAPSVPAAPPAAVPARPAGSSPPPAAKDTAAAEEIDLTTLLGELEGQTPLPRPAASAPQDLEQVFAGMRADAAPGGEADESGDYFALARTYLEMDLPQEAASSLEVAARSPEYRFAAASLLAQIYRDSSDLLRAIEWLERAAEVPAPSADEGRALLYDLGDVLETVGETGRALAIFLELDADAPGYRDVGERVTRLSKVEMEG